MATYTTYIDLCRKLREEVGLSGDSTPAAVTGQTGQMARVVNFVADADENIQKMHADWEFMWAQFSTTTSSGSRDPATTKPTNIGSYDLDSFYLDKTTTSFAKLEFVPYRPNYVNDYAVGSPSNAQPYAFTIQPDDTIKVYPPADATYTLTCDYWKKPTRMTANTDESLIPEPYRRIIVVSAKVMWAQLEDAPEILQPAMLEYQMLMDNLERRFLPSKKEQLYSEAPLMNVVRAE